MLPSLSGAQDRPPRPKTRAAFGGCPEVGSLNPRPQDVHVLRTPEEGPRFRAAPTAGPYGPLHCTLSRWLSNHRFTVTPQGLGRWHVVTAPASPDASQPQGKRAPGAHRTSQSHNSGEGNGLQPESMCRRQACRTTACQLQESDAIMQRMALADSDTQAAHQRNCLEQ